MISTKKWIRIQNPEVIDINYIESELQLDKHVIVQFSHACYSDNRLATLNTLCKKHNELLGIRFYGHYQEIFDFKILLKIPNVKCLYVDCLTKAENVHILAELQELKSLSVGIFELKDTELLKADNLKTLSALILTDTKSKALNLQYLAGFRNLKQVVISGHTKNIDAIGEISNLEYLRLATIKKTKLAFVNKLKKLKSLSILLGGRENINEITDNNIEELDIDWIRGFNNLDNISCFKQLKKLEIANCIQLPGLQFESQNSTLNDVRILNCKTFNTLNGLNHLTSLNHMRIYNTKLDVNAILNQKLAKTLSTFAFYTNKTKLDATIKILLEQKGYTAV